MDGGKRSVMINVFPRWAEEAAEAASALTLRRVVSQEKGMYRIAGPEGEQAACLSGKFRLGVETASEYPVVGDYVLVDASRGELAVIKRVLPRKSLFVRKAAGTKRTEQAVAANIDTVFLCMALNRDFNLRRLERYLAVAWDSGATPVALLTKADLADDLEEKTAAVQRTAPGTALIVTSALESLGLDQLAPYLEEGATVAFVGSSGVGKSTLVNRFLGEERLATNGLRNDDRGRHTTTRRELLCLPCGAMVIDTPGMRELGMWETGDGLGAAFSEIEALSAACRFRNCTHTSEPGCAVQAAIAAGELDLERWLSYRKLAAESAYAKNAEQSAYAKEKKFKAIAKLNKQMKKR